MINTNLNLKEQIHDSILNDIITGVYEPETILHEKKLMAKYDVSRAPIREALVQLCSERMMVAIPKKGYMVTALSLEDMHNIVYFRLALECTFLQQYSSCIDDSAIRKLEEFLDHIRHVTHSLTALEHWQNNIHFHLMLFSNYNNPFAYEKLREAMISQTRFYAQDRTRKWHSNVFSDPSSLHFAILDYLKQQNIPMAVHILRADIEDISAIV